MCNEILLFEYYWGESKLRSSMSIVMRYDLHFPMIGATASLVIGFSVKQMYKQEKKIVL